MSLGIPSSRLALEEVANTQEDALTHIPGPLLPAMPVSRSRPTQPSLRLQQRAPPQVHGALGSSTACSPR